MKEIVKKLVELRRAATQNGKSKYTAPIGECAEKVREAMISTIDRSVAFDPTIPFYWVENDDENVVAYFGCGPSSKANIDFFTYAANEVEKVCENYESLEHAYKMERMKNLNLQRRIQAFRNFGIEIVNINATEHELNEIYVQNLVFEGGAVYLENECKAKDEPAQT